MYISQDCFQWIMSHGYSSERKMPSQCRSYAANPGAAFNLAAPSIGVDSAASFGSDGVPLMATRATLAPLFDAASLI